MTTIIIRLMLGIICFILALALAFPQVQVSESAKGQLNCSTATDYQTKSNCTMIDLTPFLIVGIILALGAFLLTGI
jgi:hypothetical protein